MDMTLKVTRSGNSDVVVIPAAWKKKYGVRTGDRLRFRETPGGDIVLSAIRAPKGDAFDAEFDSLRRVYGACPDLVSMTMDEMREAAHGRDF